MYVVVNSFRSRGWQVGAVGEGVEVGLEALPRHLFPGRDFICPPCDHFTASMMNVSSPEGGDISPHLSFPAGGPLSLHMKNEHNHIHGNKSYLYKILTLGFSTSS